MKLSTNAKLTPTGTSTLTNYLTRTMKVVIFPEASLVSDFDDSLCSTCIHWDWECEECSLDYASAINDYTGVRECSEYTDEDETEEK